MEIKPIRNEEDYEEALRNLATLIDSDPAPQTEDGDKLSILSTLVENYEQSRYPESLPSPVEAIKFRMEQANLKPMDLVPYLGSRSRVSEVLAGKRTLSLDMVRALESGLGIPSKVLIQKADISESAFMSWSESLIKEMDGRGYFSSERFNGKNGELLLSKFFGNHSRQATQLAWRRTDSRVSVRTDQRALIAWSEFVRHKAAEVNTEKNYEDGVVDLAFLQTVIRFSSKDDGPLAAQKFLRDNGIVLVVADHLPKTKVDGVVILDDYRKPIIGLSLRFDRLDNFWFTLLHELAHIALHQKKESIYFDELEDSLGVSINDDEHEADELAEEAIVPFSKWEISPAKITPSSMAAESLAEEMGIGVAVAAGYIRHKNQNYFYLRKIVNSDRARVRGLFDSQLRMEGAK